MDLLLREAVPEDARAAARLLADAFPHLPVTARRVRSRMAQPLPGERPRHIAAMAGDRLVGWARSMLDARAAGQGHVLVAVLPGWRGRGIGSSLLADAEWHLARSGAGMLHAAAIEDATIGRFCAARGWHPSRWSRYLSLDLTGLDQAQLNGALVAPSGVDVLPAWLLEDQWPIYQAHTECVADEPRPGGVPPPQLDYQDWLERVWRSTDHDPAASTLALRDGRVIAFALFNVDRASGRIWSISTGTRREWRGQGLARLVTSVALHRAAERGLRTAWTTRDPDNPTIGAVHERLGFRPAVTQVVLVRHLPG